MDFDRLRSGYVTAAQFRRCIAGVLEKNVISPLTEEEVEVLMRRYSNNDGKGEGKGGMIKWMEFCDSIDKGELTRVPENFGTGEKIIS